MDVSFLLVWHTYASMWLLSNRRECSRVHIWKALSRISNLLNIYNHSKLDTLGLFDFYILVFLSNELKSFTRKVFDSTCNDAWRINLTLIRTLSRLTGLSKRAAAEEGRNPVEAGGAGPAGFGSAVIDVLWAVRSAPAIHAHAGVAARRVAARATILTGVRLQAALVHIIRAILTWRNVNQKRGCLRRHGS